MDAANEEFKELLGRSGWNQSEAARQLDLPTASISRYVNSIDKPSRQTLRLFRMLLAAKESGNTETHKLAQLSPQDLKRALHLKNEINRLQGELLERVKELTSVRFDPPMLRGVVVDRPLTEEEQKRVDDAAGNALKHLGKKVRRPKAVPPIVETSQPKRGAQ